MATGTGVSPQIRRLDENGDALETLRQFSACRPPKSLSAFRHCTSSLDLIESELEIGIIGAAAAAAAAAAAEKSPTAENVEFLPIYRSGSWTEQGSKINMEDQHICVDDLHEHLAMFASLPPDGGAFYGVFDGHGGKGAAQFTRNNILKFIVEDANFPHGKTKAVRSAFLKADNALADARCFESSCGTTALTALMFGRTMLIANVGDSRAVLGKRGRAIEVSKDHKPSATSERLRIERLGGVISDGYLNGQLSVARALGDWHMKGGRGSKSPLIGEPDLEEIHLTEEDEFLVIGCDGLWDVMSSQCAVTMVRKELMAHNDPEKCSRVLVDEALQRNTSDNLTVVVVCFSHDPPPKIEIPKFQRRRSISIEGLDRLQSILNCNNNGNAPA